MSSRWHAARNGRTIYRHTVKQKVYFYSPARILIFFEWRNFSMLIQMGKKGAERSNCASAHQPIEQMFVLSRARKFMYIDLVPFDLSAFFFVSLANVLFRVQEGTADNIKPRRQNRLTHHLRRSSVETTQNAKYIYRNCRSKINAAIEHVFRYKRTIFSICDTQ